jgi:hypothetical protein
MPHFSCSFLILHLFFIMTGITLKMTGHQHSCLSPSKIHQKCKALKLFTHHFFCFLSFKTHGIASVARLQREEVSRSKQEARGTGSISTGTYTFFEFSSFLFVANHMANCSQIYWKYCIFRNSWQMYGKSNLIQIQSISMALL